MRIGSYVLTILGLALLMVVHEAGHYFVARYFGMRVEKFSIGFGPTIWKHKPKDSPTTFQIGIIPFLAYVKIAGLNPYEDIEDTDAGSYANAKLKARIATICAGSIANYLFASVFFFFGFFLGGQHVVDETSMRVTVHPDGPAAKSGVVSGDRMVSVNGERVGDWKDLTRLIGPHGGEVVDLEIERGTERIHLHPTPNKDGENSGKIMIGPESRVVPVSVGEALVLSVKSPPKVVIAFVRGMGRMLTFKEKPQVSSVVGIVKDMSATVRDSAAEALLQFGGLSAYIGAFNLLPFPALDGGRMIFLIYEGVSRRKADAKTEAKVHVVGLVMFFMLFLFATYSDIFLKK
jgi:regulator of sigma E protease